MVERLASAVADAAFRIMASSFVKQTGSETTFELESVVGGEGGPGGNASNRHKKDFLILFRINVKISVRRLESFSYQ